MHVRMYIDICPFFSFSFSQIGKPVNVANIHLFHLSVHIMGNQLTGAAPSQILPVETYVSDIPGTSFVRSLGNTRFFKVARIR